jgi:hypothetical protein
VTFELPPVDGQVSFAEALDQIRDIFLQDALSKTVASLKVDEINKDLSLHVPDHSLSLLAAQGLRGELFFPVPVVLRANPRLLAYYRLLYGFSAKAFYHRRSGCGPFSSMENRGEVRSQIADQIPALCEAGATLLAAIGTRKVTSALLDDLTLLTLGTQLRGGANVRKGIAGIRTVFNSIREIVKDALADETESSMRLINSAGRAVQIEFAPDPDIVIREDMKSGQSRAVLAVEVKAGSDQANIHNRLGEAEKSHQKARGMGFNEFWTIVNVDELDMSFARSESPTTNQFYRLSSLIAAEGAEYDDFRDRIVSLTNIE